MSQLSAFAYTFATLISLSFIFRGLLVLDRVSCPTRSLKGHGSILHAIGHRAEGSFFQEGRGPKVVWYLMPMQQDPHIHFCGLLASVLLEDTPVRVLSNFAFGTRVCSWQPISHFSQRTSLFCLLTFVACLATIVADSVINLATNDAPITWP